MRLRPSALGKRGRGAGEKRGQGAYESDAEGWQGSDAEGWQGSDAEGRQGSDAEGRQGSEIERKQGREGREAMLGGARRSPALRTQYLRRATMIGYLAVDDPAGEQ